MDGQRDAEALETLARELKTVRAGLRRVLISIAVLTMMVILLAVSVFGSLMNYFAGDALLFGSATAAAGVIGFICGWVACRRAG